MGRGTRIVLPTAELDEAVAVELVVGTVGAGRAGGHMTQTVELTREQVRGLMAFLEHLYGPPRVSS